MNKFNPPVSGSTFETKDFRGDIIVHEQVWFVSDVDIACNPPYVKGKIDYCWVKYRKDSRPTTKEGWQKILGLEIQEML